LDAQEGPPEAKIETPDSGRPYPPHVVDGQRRGLPEEVFAVAPGTRFLVGLEQEMNTKSLRRNQAFRVRTLEPLEAGQGFYLPAGAVIEGHVSRVEPAGKAGRAKLWLTFDEIRTRFGRLPIVAEVASLPGDHTTKNGPMTNGAIEGHGSTQKDAAQAAATGAAMGALKGVQDKNKKEAAEAAAIAALEAYLMEAGRGEELDLPKGTKLELELGRALYLVKE
jgi:Mor family transcriptional regulator